MLEQFSRTELLLGREAMEKLGRSRVAIFGIGGVGGYVCEALVRSGVGAFDLVDSDRVCLSNINRQIIATRDTVGEYKVDVMRRRMLEINPEAEVRVYKCFFLPENAAEFPFEEYDYVVDAVDTVTAKIALVMCAREKNIPIISSMGAGNKLDATAFRVADIYETKVCPLAKVMRRELKKRGVEKLKVVYSEEAPVTRKRQTGMGERMDSGHPGQPMETDCGSDIANGAVVTAVDETLVTAEDEAMETIETTDGKRIPGSVAFVPSVAGFILAGEVVKDLTV